MNIFLTLCMMIVVGAMIGGLTNSLAIKMLFRPYEAKYIGKWRIPFTPGLIPKRRDQLAVQLGQLVVNHLITEESIQAKLKEERLRNQLIKLLSKEFDQFLQKQITIDQLLRQFHLSISKQDVEKRVGEWIVELYQQRLDQHQSTQLKDFFNTEAEKEIEEVLEKVSTYLHKRIVSMLEGPSTQVKIEKVINQYAQSKGFFGNMVLSMFSSEDLSTKVQVLFVQYIQSADGYRWLHQAVQQEWIKLKDSTLSDYRHVLERDLIKSMINQLVRSNLPIQKWLQTNAPSLLRPFATTIKQKVVPDVVNAIFKKMVKNIPEAFKHLEMEKMVEKQVAAFPTERIEQIILSISRKEFKLITYLGALLGGIIGLIQGLLFILVG